MKKGQYTPVQKKIELEWQKSDFGQDILAWILQMGRNTFIKHTSSEQDKQK